MTPGRLSMHQGWQSHPAAEAHHSPLGTYSFTGAQPRASRHALSVAIPAPPAASQSPWRTPWRTPWRAGFGCCLDVSRAICQPLQQNSDSTAHKVPEKCGWSSQTSGGAKEDGTHGRLLHKQIYVACRVGRNRRGLLEAGSGYRRSSGSGQGSRAPG